MVDFLTDRESVAFDKGKRPRQALLLVGALLAACCIPAVAADAGEGTKAAPASACAEIIAKGVSGVCWTGYAHLFVLFAPGCGMTSSPTLALVVTKSGAVIGTSRGDALYSLSGCSGGSTPLDANIPVTGRFTNRGFELEQLVRGPDIGLPVTVPLVSPNEAHAGDTHDDDGRRTYSVTLSREQFLFVRAKRPCPTDASHPDKGFAYIGHPAATVRQAASADSPSIGVPPFGYRFRFDGVVNQGSHVWYHCAVAGVREGWISDDYVSCDPPPRLPPRKLLRLEDLGLGNAHPTSSMTTAGNG